ncbi:MAG TPA: hypothetical protein VG871_24585 [Vicinamibacterales bacterium]|nr:hypothetical protein [Vicinamibacterales bacterium]
MANAVDHLERVGGVVQDVRDLGLEPILVGGMALVVSGSRRVTRDFDFVVASPRRCASTPPRPGGDRRPVIVCSCLAAAHSLQAMSVRISMRPSSPRSIVCNPSWLDDFAIDIDRSDSTESSSRRTENEVEIRHPDIDLEMNDAACT